MKRTLLLLLSITCICHAYSQRPLWVEQGAPDSESGKYYYAMGSGESLEEAIYETVKVGVKMQGITSTTEQQINKAVAIINNKRNSSFNSSGTIDFEDKKVKLFVADQYIEYSQSKYYVLLGFCKDINTEPPQKPKLAAGKFLLRSTIVPGWGQAYNFEYGKLALFLGTEVALLGTAIYLNGRVDHYYTQAENANRADQIEYYLDKRDQTRNTQYIVLAGAAAVWVINMVDAGVSNKERFAMFNASNVQLFADVNRAGIAVRF